LICKIFLEKGALMPKKNNKSDNCYDVFSNNDYKINNLSTCVIGTGIHIDPEPGWGMLIRPRSGKSSQGIILGGGEVDNGYRGEIGVIIHNMTGSSININKGEKIAQIRPVRIEDIDFIQVQELSNSDRGSKGFGASGDY
jgi:dUTP pyrophosphatase